MGRGDGLRCPRGRRVSIHRLLTPLVLGCCLVPPGLGDSARHRCRCPGDGDVSPQNASLGLSLLSWATSAALTSPLLSPPSRHALLSLPCPPSPSSLHTLCLQVPLDPLPICQLDPEPLLLRAAEEPRTGRQVEDTPENRRKGWWRVCLFATFVVPSTQKCESLSVRSGCPPLQPAALGPLCFSCGHHPCPLHFLCLC